MEEFRPGQVISPQATTDKLAPQAAAISPQFSEQPEVASTPITAPQTVTAQQPEPQSPALIAPAPQPLSLGTEDVDKIQHPLHRAVEPTADMQSDELVWTASEFIAHEKTAKWYGVLAAAGIVGALLDYLVVKDVFSTVIILLVAVIFGVYASRKPRTIRYGLHATGISIADKLYAFSEFKTFSIAEEGVIASIVFMPLRRFMPALTIYVPREHQEQVVEYLGDVLPFAEHKADAVDSLLRRIRY